jgi:hypothetical protein
MRKYKIDPDVAARRARTAAAARWNKVTDPEARQAATAAARATNLRRYEDLVDPQRKYSEEVRAKLVAAARRARMAELRLAYARKRAEAGRTDPDDPDVGVA